MKMEFSPWKVGKYSSFHNFNMFSLVLFFFVKMFLHRKIFFSRFFHSIPGHAESYEVRHVVSHYLLIFGRLGTIQVWIERHLNASALVGCHSKRIFVEQKRWKRTTKDFSPFIIKIHNPMTTFPSQQSDVKWKIHVKS